MRARSDADKLRRLMEGIGRECHGGRVYLVGGASAVLIGWRETTIDADLKLDPEPSGAFEAIAKLKNSLDMNVELAAPDDFIPPLPDWRERSPFICRQGDVDFFHYDFYAQALAKIERGHRQDVDDVRAMIARGLVEVPDLVRLFGAIEPQLIRYPALDRVAFREKVEHTVAETGGGAR